MARNNQNQTLIDFIDKIQARSSVFFYSEDCDEEKLLGLLSEQVFTKHSLPVIHIYWNENKKNSTQNLNKSTSFTIFKNFTSTLIKIEKLLAAEEQVLILADISTIPQGQSSKPYIHFLSILLHKCDKHKSTVMAIAKEEDINSDIVSSFNNRFLLKNRRIKEMDDSGIDLLYEITGNILHLEPHMQSDMSKLKEIFSLTPEEKEELDKLVGQSLEEYRTSM